MSTHLIEIVERLPSSRIVLVGDLMLDRYLFGDAERVSPEAPVPVLHYQSEEFRLGGAANVAANLAVLGANVKVIGVVGNDDAADQVTGKLIEFGVDASSVVRVDNRPTVCKMRLVGSSQHKNPQQLIRLDFEDPAPVSGELEATILSHIEKALSQQAEMLCIEDYNKGLLSETLTPKIIAMAKARNIPVIIDPANIPDYRKYKGATAIKLNRPEAERATGMEVRTPEQYQPVTQKLVKDLDLEAAIVTLDRQGSYLATRDGEGRWLKTRQRQVADGTGAGDMVLAMLAMARAAGADWPDAVAMANIAGGLEVEKFGVVPIKPAEIVQELMAER